MTRSRVSISPKRLKFECATLLTKSASCTPIIGKIENMLEHTSGFSTFLAAAGAAAAPALAPATMPTSASSSDAFFCL